jgi:hypothetical protein
MTTDGSPVSGARIKNLEFFGISKPGLIARMTSTV